MNFKSLALVGVMLGAISAPAFVGTLTPTGNQKRWDLVNLPGAVSTNIVNPNTRAVRYYLAPGGWSTTNTAAELNAVRASFDQWQAVSGTILKFEFAGSTLPGPDINTSDHSNVIFWAKSSTLVNGGHDDITGALGVTFSSVDPSGAILEADIVLNGVRYGWYTDFTYLSTNQFVEGTTLHEIGHLIGLDHSPLGGATMFASSVSGISPQTGLSTDEMLGVRFLYPQTNQAALRATLQGQITRDGIGILGAAVIAEDTNGTVVAGAVSRAGGAYDLSAMPPGAYLVRVTPLDPNGVDWLVRGRDISASYNTAETSFLPTTNTPVTLTAGLASTLNFSVVNAEPAFRITDLRNATANPFSFSWAGQPILLRQGQSNLTVGVASPNLPTNNATLDITGDGLTLGPLVFRTNAFQTGLNFISTPISVSSNATPGLRSLIVRQGANRAYANGFLDIVPAHPDYNFDALDDYFQRQYFPLWTSTNAAPGADPDGDGVVNSDEYLAGTVPTDPASLLRIDQLTQTMAGTTITWRSVTGKRYQVSSRAAFGIGAWQTLGSPVTASGSTADYFDAGATNGQRFYRVAAISAPSGSGDNTNASQIVLYETGWEAAPANPPWGPGNVSPQNGWLFSGNAAGHQVVVNGSADAIVNGQAVATPSGQQFHKFVANPSVTSTSFRDAWPDITAALAGLPSTHKILKASIDVFVPSAQDGVAGFYGVVAYHNNGNAPWGVLVDPSDHSVNLFLDDAVPRYQAGAFQLDTWFNLSVTANYATAQISIAVNGVNLPSVSGTSTKIGLGNLTDVDLVAVNYLPQTPTLRAAFSDNFRLTAESVALPHVTANLRTR